MLLSPWRLDAQSISIRNDYSFHAFQVGPEFGVLEDVSDQDEGGILYLFVDNLAPVEDSILDITIKDSADNVIEPTGWYPWPGVMNTANGNFTGITIKGSEIPLKEGSYVKVIVSSVNGAMDSLEVFGLSTPRLRFGNIVPSQDGASTYLYVRNEGVFQLQIDSVLYNTEGFSESDPEIEFSGTGLVDPGEMEIIELSGASSYSETSLAAVRIKYHELPSLTEHFVSAATRSVEPKFYLGTWHSSAFNPDKEYGRKLLRGMGIQMVQGPGNYGFMNDGYNRYHMRTVREPGFGDPFDVANAIAEMTPHIGNPMMDSWSVDDEPDLNGKEIDQQLEKALTYMRTDDDTPVHITLAMQKKYQQYGFYSDIVAMDHYSAPSAPNIIPLTWIPVIGRTGEIKESLEYSEYLKWNTEPRRNWSWVQYAAGVWDVQPEPIAVNYQFWAHVMGGAKGLKFFVAQSDSKEDYPSIWDEGIRTFKEFKQIRNVALYGEPNNWISASDTNVLVRSLIGPESMTTVVVNNSIAFEGNVVDGFETNWSEFPYFVDVFVPDWVATDDVYWVTEVGKSYDLTAETIGPNTLRITPDSLLAERSHIFYIGPNDVQNPAALEGLLVAEYLDSANYTFSWKEAYDNVGVQGYNIYYNDSLVEKVSGLVYEVEDKSLNCSAYWKVEPFDNSGNLGTGDSLFFVLSGPPLAVEVQPIDDLVGLGGTSVLEVIPNSVVSYQWQYFNGASWENFEESLNAIGTNTSVLELNNLYVDVMVRCVMTSPCDGSLVSDEATITVVDDSGVEENELQMKVYPNPTSGLVDVLVSSQEGDWSLMDMNGRTLLEKGFSKNTFQLDLSDLPKGFYVLQIRSDAGVALERLIKS